MSAPDVSASVERLQAITESVRQVLEGKQLWLTPAEFLANVESHRRAHDKKIKPEPYKHSKVERVYVLSRPVINNRQREFLELEVAG